MRRGHALVLVVAALAALSTVSAVVIHRLNVDLDGRRAEDARAEALWLARSAVARAQPGRRTVRLSRGSAQLEVTVRAGEIAAAVQYQGATALVQARPGPGRGAFSTWTERYDRAQPKPPPAQ